MFRSRAHSFTQQARLAVSLSWIAGYTNALTVLTCNQVTSHMTGTMSQIGVEVANGQWSVAGYLASLVLMFLLGAFTSGAMSEFGRVRRLQSIFVLPMAVEAVLLAAFALLVDWRALGELATPNARLWLTFLPAFAMGLQNATITGISGGVVRTTHVTGIVTDLGLELSKLLFRSRGKDRNGNTARAQVLRRALLLFSIPGSFALGAGLGAVAFVHVPAWSMLPACLFLGFLTLQNILAPVAAAALRERPCRGAPITALFAAEAPANARRFRLPDLTTWAADLDHHARVVVIDVGRLRGMGERSALELRALLLHLRAAGRHLVLAGIGAEQMAVMNHAAVLPDFDADDLCGDLAAAMQRAEQLAQTL